MLFALGVPQRWLHTAQFPLPYCPCVLCAKRKFRKYFTPMIIRLIDGAVCFSRNRSAHTTTTAHNLNGSLLVAWFSAFICHSINMTRWLGWNLEKNNNEPFHGSRSHRSASNRTSKRESSYSRPSGFLLLFLFQFTVIILLHCFDDWYSIYVSEEIGLFSLLHWMPLCDTCNNEVSTEWSGNDRRSVVESLFRCNYSVNLSHFT